MDRLYSYIHGVQEPYKKPTVADKIDMIEELLDNGSVYGMSVDEVLESPKSRRAVALAIAARNIHARPEIEMGDEDAEDIKATGTSYWDTEKGRQARLNSAYAMNPPSRETRAGVYTKSRHPNPKFQKSVAPPTAGYRGAEGRQSVTHVNPIETEHDFRHGPNASGKAGVGRKDYSDNKSRQKDRNVANADKILGTKDKEGYAYATNRDHARILSKLAAHADDDKKAMTHSQRAQFDREWKDAMDAKAERVHGKKQFAGNKQYDTLGTEADNVVNDYKDSLNARKTDGTLKPGMKDEIDAHNARVKHHTDLKRHLEKNPPQYKEVTLRDGKKGKVANTGFEMSPKLKYHRDLDNYKRAQARYEPAGEKPKEPKEDNRKGLDVNKRREIERSTPQVKHHDYVKAAESFDPSKDSNKLNPNVHTSNIGAVLKDLRRALLKVPDSEREVLGKAFPSKYGKGNGYNIAAALQALPKTEGIVAPIVAGAVALSGQGDSTPSTTQNAVHQDSQQQSTNRTHKRYWALEQEPITLDTSTEKPKSKAPPPNNSGGMWHDFIQDLWKGARRPKK